ncbi:MAG: penicillin acylase family protein [Salinisphaeraceae bacterium]|nr:penicillin acylase family protein [Salinisphaeraceae bacterium]
MLRLLCLGVAVTLLSCSGSNSSDDDDTNPGAFQMKALNTLPPGQSGFVSLAGQIQGTASMSPEAFGPNLDDQRLLYWNVEHKDGSLRAKCADPVTPHEGVEVCRDEFGVPAVYADTLYGLSWGSGYAVAQDRLFLMDAVRRMAGGTLAELAGCPSLAEDIQARVLTYTEAEYQAMYDGLSDEFKAAVDGYIDGANAWVAAVMSDPANLLPAEYAVLTAQPEPFSQTDVMRAAVLITRTVAAEGGNEFSNIRMLKQLEAEFGRDSGRDIFHDIVWLEDPKATVSIPASEGTFSNHPMPAGGRDAAFNTMADWATSLPDSLAKGPGTADAALPAECGLSDLPDLPFDLPVGLGAGESQAAESAESSEEQAAKHKAEQAKAREAVMRKAAAVLREYRRGMHGGSFLVAIGPSRTRDGGTLLMSEPQLGYTYPSLLVEVELNGAGYNVRGSTVPLLPVVGIGYNNYVAWALTTGYSKTIDSFIETIRREAGQLQYLHNGQWQDMDCRMESFNFPITLNGVPAGPDLLSTEQEVCRTVHGPVVAMDESAGLARTVTYAMWMQEVGNADGINTLMRATNFDQVDEAIRSLTWNENIAVATRDGHIAYYHPGLHYQRNAQTDQRLPIPGEGEFDFNGFISKDNIPHVIDPAQGFVANWNNKPAFGWLDGVGVSSTSRPGGAGHRVTTLIDEISAKNDWTFEDLKSLDSVAGKRDQRARDYLPVLQGMRNREAANLADFEAAALDMMLGWDKSAYGPGIDLADEAATDGPAATIFGVFVEALRDELFSDLKSIVIDPESGQTAFQRQSFQGSHLFDMSALDNLALRILAPSTSGLPVRHDWLNGRTGDEVLLAAVREALNRLRDQFGGSTPLTVAELDNFRRVHPRVSITSLTGIVGPSSTMPYQDRGSWVHLVGYEK